MTNSSSKFPGDRVYLVEHRLEFVQIISSLQEQFSDIHPTSNTPYGGWTHPWKHFDSLRNYLLLTCFDSLGQPEEFVTFESWLKRSSGVLERQAGLDTLGASDSPIQVTEKLHRAYLDSYGTRRSFYRFLDTVLPETALDDLMFSIRIRRIDSRKNTETEIIDSIAKRKDFLFRTRNRYTHDVTETGNASAAVFPGFDSPMIIDGIEKWGYVPVYWDHRQHDYLEYSVRKWPSVLVEAVRTGLGIVKGEGATE